MGTKTLNNAFLSVFCLEMAMLQQAGVAMFDGVLMLQDDEPSREGKAVLQNLLDTLNQGAPLSEALSRAEYFPNYMVQMVRIGEKTGRLTETLRALNGHYDRQERLATALKNALLYPSILLVMMVAVVIILIVQVLPIFDDVFRQLGVQMSPLATRLMQFGAWLREAAALIALVLGAILLLAFLAWFIPSLRERIVTYFKETFGHRGIFGKVASSRFASAMVLALSSGLDTFEAVEMAATLSGDSRTVKHNNEQCLEILRSGGTLAEAMQRSGILSARDGRMLSLGSRSGMADQAMAEIASRSESSTQESIDRLVSRIEPTLVIITSVIVGVILLSVMLPLVSIMTSIG